MVTTAPAQREHLVTLDSTVFLEARGNRGAVLAHGALPITAEVPVQALGREIHVPYGPLFATARGAINLTLRDDFADVDYITGQGWGKVEVHGKTYHYAFLVQDVTKMRGITRDGYLVLIDNARAAAGLPALPAIES